MRNPNVVSEPPDPSRINVEAWRQGVQSLLEQHINSSPDDRPSPILLLLDDNFYYPSMRYEVFQLARKCKCSDFEW